MTKKALGAALAPLVQQLRRPDAVRSDALRFDTDAGALNVTAARHYPLRARTGGFAWGTAYEGHDLTGRLVFSVRSKADAVACLVYRSAELPDDYDADQDESTRPGQPEWHF